MFYSKYKDYVRFLDVIFFIMIILIKFYVSMVWIISIKSKKEY